MHPTRFVLFAAVAATLTLTSTRGAEAQTLSINGGTPCNYSQYVKTVGTNGVPNFAFTAAGCSTGGSTPVAGTMQFTAASYGSISTGGTTQVLVTNVGRVTGGGNALTGSVTSNTPTVCTVPANSTVNFSDSDLNNKSVTVTGVAAGACVIALSGTGTATPNQASIGVVDPNTPGTLAFTTASQSAVAGQASVTFTVAQTGAGANAPASSVSYTCISTGVPSGTYTPAFTPASSGTLNWNLGENASKTFSSTVPALPGGATSATITCQISSPTGGANLGGQQTHQVTVTNQAVPVCTPTVTTVPGSLITGTGGTANFTANCTNSPSGFTWAAVTAGAPTLTNATTATPSATVGAGVAAGTYQYSLVASNGGGNSTLVNASFTVSAAPTANCAIKDRATDYPNWGPGNNPAPFGSNGSVGAPEVNQLALETIAYRFQASDLYNTTDPNAAGNFSLYEPTLGVATTMSITASPCDFTNSATLPVCQRTSSNGNFGLQYARNTHPAPNDGLVNAGYCRLPTPGAGDVYYVNIRYAPAASAANPTGSTCTQGSCRYVPLYVRNS